MDPIGLILIGIIGLIGLVWTVLTGRPPKFVPPRPVSDVEKKADADARAKEREAKETRDEAVEKAMHEREEAVTDLTSTLEDKADELLEDGDALNRHLKDVGKTVRSDGGT